jgi:hypothetical protein
MATRWSKSEEDNQNAGTTWCQQPILVNGHGFRSDAEGIALPYGIHDINAHHGCLFVGTSHDTPALAVDNIVRWWNYHGRRRYPAATEMRRPLPSRIAAGRVRMVVEHRRSRSSSSL